MSTRSSIKYGDDAKSGTNFHLYQECFEDDSVYLELTGKDIQFEANGHGVQVRIPLAVWEAIRSGTNGILQSPYGHKTDEELTSMVTKEVDERIDYYNKGDKFRGFCGILTYGAVDEPREDQIARGLTVAKSIRDQIAEIEKFVAEANKK